MRVRLCGSRLLGLGHLGLQVLELLVQRVLVREHDRKLLITLPQSFFKRAQLLRSLLAGRRAPGYYAAGSKASPGAGRPARA